MRDAIGDASVGSVAAGAAALQAARAQTWRCDFCDEGEDSTAAGPVGGRHRRCERGLGSGVDGASSTRARTSGGRRGRAGMVVGHGAAAAPTAGTALTAGTRGLLQQRWGQGQALETNDRRDRRRAAGPAAAGRALRLFFYFSNQPLQPVGDPAAMGFIVTAAINLTVVQTGCKDRFGAGCVVFSVVVHVRY